VPTRSLSVRLGGTICRVLSRGERADVKPTNDSGPERLRSYGGKLDLDNTSERIMLLLPFFFFLGTMLTTTD
jgi:hypothetical protein